MSNKEKNSNRSINKINTLDNKHNLIIKKFNQEKKNKENILNQIKLIQSEIDILNERSEFFSSEEIKHMTELLDKKNNLEYEYNNNIYNEMDYYDNVGDLIIDYYELRENNNDKPKETKNILEYLCSNKNFESENKNNSNNKAKLFEKYCHRLDGTRLNHDDGSNRIKYCLECNIEKIFDMSESAYICIYCGDSENIILDEDRQIKDYSPYKRLNHFREWLNQFQAKQSSDIPEKVFVEIIRELNKNRVTDLSVLNNKNMKSLLKKLNYNCYYEHVTYIINKLNNLPPPKITKDMEKQFINMFYQIQEPWEKYKQTNRKNFLSYSYVLHKFCELLELDHLLECFPLHKDPEKIIENDNIWEKICKYLKWQFISSFK
jgi:hypothetical protein